MRVAVLGLGRSGLAIAEAAMRAGDEAVVFDALSRERLAKLELAARLDHLGIELRDGYVGTLPPGFDQVVTNPAVSKRSPVLLEALSRGVEVIGEIEFAYRIARAPIVAITGTNGKSTTTAMAYRCLEAIGERPRLCGNIFGSGLPETTLTEAASVAGPDETLVAEVSSFQLEWVRDFRPAVAAITNISPDHLDRYDGFDDYARTKARLFAGQREGDYAILRAGDPVARFDPASSAERRTVGAFGEESEYDERELRIIDRRIPIASLAARESHNVANAGMAAIAADSLQRWRAHHDPTSDAARTIGVGIETARKAVASSRSVYASGLPLPTRSLDERIVGALRGFRGLAHRMERLEDRDGVHFVNNSMCTNPAAVIASVQSLESNAHVLIGGKNKELDFRPLGRFFAAGRHRPYIFGSDGASIAAMMGGGASVYSTMDDAFAAAVSAAQPGETVILAPGCASTDGFVDFRARGERFRALAEEWRS